MNTSFRSLLLLLFATTACGAAPGDPARCVSIDDDVERLHCYDAALGRHKPAAPTSQAGAAAAAPKTAVTTAPAKSAAAAPAASAAAVPAATASGAAAKGSSAGADSNFGMNSKLRRETQEEQGAAPEPKELTAKVTKVQRSPEGYFTVWLDNGQTWRQMEVIKDLAFAAGDSVTIRRTFSGGYLMRNDSGNRAGYARRLE